MTLLDNLKLGDTVFTKLNHVSRSGMTRGISLYVIKDNEPYDISWLATEKMGNKLHKKGGVKISGCGMDMGFALVYDLSRRLFPEGYGKKCFECGLRPKDKTHAVALAKSKSCEKSDSGEHRFFQADSNAPGWDNDGGYALTHRWL